MYYGQLRRYWILAAVLFLLLLLLFTAGVAAGVPIVTDPAVWLEAPGPAAATVGVGLLIADVGLPVPSSIVMVAHGVLFGVWVGTLLSLIGSVGASLVGFALGRAGNEVLRRLVTPPEYERAGILLDRWGTLAIFVTRPVPLLAETVAILAGASRLTWSRMLVAAVAGSFPAAFLYALAGATGASIGGELTVFAVVLLVAGVTWWVGRRVNIGRQRLK